MGGVQLSEFGFLKNDRFFTQRIRVAIFYYFVRCHFCSGLPPYFESSKMNDYYDEGDDIEMMECQHCGSEAHFHEFMRSVDGGPAYDKCPMCGEIQD